MKKKTTATITVAALLVGGGLAAWGGSVFMANLHVGSAHYDTVSAAPLKGDLPKVLPKWVPDDATDIDVHFDTRTTGYDISFASESGVDTAVCTPIASPPAPALEVSWLPDDRTSDVVACPPSVAHGTVYVKKSGAKYVGWDSFGGTKSAPPVSD